MQNPAKNNLGLVSKQILDKVNATIRTRNKYNQWKNTKWVIDWFNSVRDKGRHSFLVFDIGDFYPSISKVLEFAKRSTTLIDEDIEIIKHSRKTLLFDGDEPWVKRGNSPMFDAAMGSYDEAEVCEMVGLYALHILSTKYTNANIGLYRDDGLAVFRSTNGRVLDKIRKEFSKVFEELGLKITVQSNLKVVGYLDITLNL